MDLVSIHPVFNLYNYEWPIYTDYGPYPPAKFVKGSQGQQGRGAQLGRLPRRASSRGASVTNSVLSPRCHIHSCATITDSVLLDGVEVGRNAVVQRAILDKNVRVPEGATHRGRPRGRPGARLPRDRVRASPSSARAQVIKP